MPFPPSLFVHSPLPLPPPTLPSHSPLPLSPPTLPSQLVLRDNQIKEVPPEIAYCSNLQQFHLQVNQINVLPVELGEKKRREGGEWRGMIRRQGRLLMVVLGTFYAWPWYQGGQQLTAVCCSWGMCSADWTPHTRHRVHCTA